jgi:Cysteine-rich secretory protein family
MHSRVALLVLLITSAAQAKAESPDEQALRLLNHYRQLAGLTPVKLDSKLSTGCMEHANYMLQNQGTDAMAGLNPHTQRSNLPGASAAGAACAKAADLFPKVSNLGVAIDVWMAGMYHRRPMLDPQLERIGVGYARLPDGMLTAALRFENATRKLDTWPVTYPADKQTGVPLDYGAEFPNPIPNHGTGGYAITLQFPPFDKISGVNAKLTDAEGNPIQFFLSDPEHPATSFGQFGVICLIPKLSLEAQHAYTVRIDATWKGKPGTWTWSFSTASLRAIEASDDRAVAGAMNVASLVHGAVAYGGMRNSETVFLQLAAGEGSHYKMSVIIPIAVWRQIAGTAEPGSFKGKIIEVQTTPQFVGANHVNMTISAPTQLRVVAAR